jgi:hypothetical protein
MVESSSMLSTAATNITVSDRRTGATKRSAKRDIPFESLGLLCSLFIPGAFGCRLEGAGNSLGSLSMPDPGYREKGHGPRAPVAARYQHL